MGALAEVPNGIYVGTRNSLVIQLLEPQHNNERVFDAAKGWLLVKEEDDLKRPRSRDALQLRLGKTFSPNTPSGA